MKKSYVIRGEFGEWLASAMPARWTKNKSLRLKFRARWTAEIVAGISGGVVVTRVRKVRG